MSVIFDLKISFHTEVIVPSISCQLTNIPFPNYNDSLLIAKKPSYTRSTTKKLHLQMAYYHATTAAPKSMAMKPIRIEDLLSCKL